MVGRNGENAKAPKARRGRLGLSGVPTAVRWFVVLIVPSAIAYGFLIVLIAGFLPELGVSPGSVGLILGSLGAALVLGAIPLGLLGDRIGRKPILVTGLFLLPPVVLVFAFTSDVAVLIAAGVAAGILEGAFLSSWNAAIADQTKVENREAAFALSFMVATLAIGAGYAIPVVFPIITAQTDLGSVAIHRDATVVVALASFLSPIGLLRKYDGRKPASAEKRAAASPRAWGPLWKFSSLNALIGLGAGFIIPLIPTWLFLRFGVPDTFSGPLLGLASVTIGFAAVGSAWLSRRYGPVRAIVLTQGVSTVFMVALVFSTTALVAGAVYLVRAALMNMSSPISDSFLMGIIRPDQRGLASAVNSIFWRLPNSISTVVGGVLLASGDLNLPILLATGFYVVSIAGFYTVFRGVRPQE